MFTVKVSQKNGPEKVIEFSDGEVRIGRVSSNEIVLPKSNISKRHALLTHSLAGLAISDTKSTNGTFVNGERINGVCDLSLGDKIYLGEFTVEVVNIQVEQAIEANPSRIETKSQPKLDPVPAPSGNDKILSDDWGANGEISDSWTGDWKSQTAQARPDSAAVDVLDMASGFPTIEPSIEAHDFAPEVIIPPAPATATTPISNPILPYTDGASTASVVENLDLADMDLDLDEPEESEGSSETLVALMEDASVQRIELNEPGPVFVDRGQGTEQTSVHLTKSDIQGFLNSLLKQAAMTSKADQPLLDFTLPNGAQVQVTQAPIAINGPHITIHKTPPHPENLDALSQDNLGRGPVNFLKQVLAQGRSIVVAVSNYSSNPFHILGALAGSIEGNTRIVTIAHGAQFNIQKSQSICLRADNQTKQNSELLQHALCLKPGYIVDGPSRSSLENIETLICAGHRSFLTTIYAATADEASALLLLKSPKGPDILVMQENGASGQAIVTGIFEASENDYSPLFIRTPGGSLEAIGELTKLR